MMGTLDDQKRRAEIIANAEAELLDSPVTMFLMQKLKLFNQAYVTEIMLEYLLCFYLFPTNGTKKWLKDTLRPALYQGREEIIYNLCTMLPENMQWHDEKKKNADIPLTPQNFIDTWVIIMTLLGNLCPVSQDKLDGIFQNTDVKRDQYDLVNQIPRSKRTPVGRIDLQITIKIPYYIPLQWESEPMANILTLFTMNVRFIFPELRNPNVLRKDWVLFWTKLAKVEILPFELREVAPKCIPLQEDWLSLVLFELRHAL